ncbi:MAG TPA: YkgJ family cysteine cluster protein [Methylomirabilota bacterium]|jgi:hypothetical protein|nr:YkgJ family cysteine cluster protein [Methylomirabilota bacterium]
MAEPARRVRDTPFAYACHRCRRCCHDKRIHVNPYEVARLARNRALSTTDVLERYTTAAGTELQTTDTGACVFLTDAGCGVHADRPLVCRLYPLGRHIDTDGGETFSELAPHPETEGVYSLFGTVDAYLEAQGVRPFTAAADRYLELITRLSARLSEAVQADPEVETDVRAALDAPTEGTIPEWLDLDRVVEAWRRERDLPPPATIEDAMAMHIEALDHGGPR